MREQVWVALLFLAAMMSGCMTDSGEGPGSDGDEGTSDAPSIQAGDDLGTITYQEQDDVSAAVTQPDCANGGGVSNNYVWTIPKTNDDDVAWKAQELTVTVTGSDSAIDLDVYLEKDGEELGSSTETGPDEEESVSVTVQDVTPGELKIRVQVCTSAAQASYTIDGTAAMVAT